ncbi:MAG: hypothetical protein U0K75_00635 [Christensenellaceae bacterium]|nr:hypothetical protein [Christensenellaceae bacterium]
MKIADFAEKGVSMRPLRSKCSRFALLASLEAELDIRLMGAEYNYD